MHTIYPQGAIIVFFNRKELQSTSESGGNTVFTADLPQ